MDHDMVGNICQAQAVNARAHHVMKCYFSTQERSVLKVEEGTCGGIQEVFRGCLRVYAKSKGRGRR